MQYIESINSFDEMMNDSKNIPYPYKLTELKFYTVKKKSSSLIQNITNLY